MTEIENVLPAPIPVPSATTFAIFNPDELTLIIALINIAWESGSVKSEATGVELSRLRQKCEKIIRGEKQKPA